MTVIKKHCIRQYYLKKMNKNKTKTRQKQDKRKKIKIIKYCISVFYDFYCMFFNKNKEMHQNLKLF